MIVLDASVAVYWAMGVPGSDLVEPTMNEAFNGRAVVPTLWNWEVSSAILKYDRAGRLTEAEAYSVMARLRSIPLKFEVLTLDDMVSEVLPLAKAHGLSVYDASYLFLSKALGVPLATMDKQLLKAARDCGLAYGESAA